MTLQYDNAASVFFGITLLVLYLVPACVAIARRIRGFYDKEKKIKDQARTAAEAAKLKRLAADNVLWTRGFTLFVATTVLAVILLLVLIFFAGAAPELAVYDPYAVLGLNIGATDAEIKNAYRRLSRLKHPDRGGDPEEFVALSKAYTTLTDPVAKENYENYGNPDGRQALQISIGLPMWLTEGMGKHVLLIGYLAVLVIAVPTMMWSCYRANKHKGAGGLHEATIQWLALRMAPNLDVRFVPEILAGAREFEKFNFSPLDVQELDTVARALKADGKMPGITNFDKSVLPRELIALNTVLIWAHMARRPLRSPALQDMQLKILQQVEPVLGLDAELIAPSYHFNPPPQYRNPKAPVDFSKSIRAILESEQMITQAMAEPGGEASLRTVLPDAVAAALTNKRLRPATAPRIVRLRDYLALPEEERAKALGNDVPPEQAQEALRVMRDIPVLQVTAKAFTAEEEVIAENDVVTLSVDVKHQNLAADASVPHVYAPQFPLPRKEEWYILLIDDRSERMVALQKFVPTRGQETAKLNFNAPARRGRYTYRLWVISNCYMGVDEEVELTIEVAPAPEVKQEKEAAEDVAAHRTQEVFLESYLGGRVDESDTEDEEEEEVDEDAEHADDLDAQNGANATQPDSKGQGKKAKGKPKKAVAEDDDESFAPSILVGAKPKKKNAPKATEAPAAAAPASDNMQ